MAGNKIPEVLLNSGHKMPVIGMGTATDNRPSNDVLASIFVDAIQVGYRHFDSASVYGSEESIGLAVAKAIEQGLIKSREEVFITSKPWNTDADYDLIVPALRTTLKKLGSSALAKRFNKERMKQNLEIFDFELSGDDLDKIKQIPQSRQYLGKVWLSENGSCKTLEELWDGDV